MHVSRQLPMHFIQTRRRRKGPGLEANGKTAKAEHSAIRILFSTLDGNARHQNTLSRWEDLAIRILLAGGGTRTIERNPINIAVRQEDKPTWKIMLSGY